MLKARGKVESCYSRLLAVQFKMWGPYKKTQMEPFGFISLHYCSCHIYWQLRWRKVSNRKRHHRTHSNLEGTNGSVAWHVYVKMCEASDIYHTWRPVWQPVSHSQSATASQPANQPSTPAALGLCGREGQEQLPALWDWPGWLSDISHVVSGSLGREMDLNGNQRMFDFSSPFNTL